MSINEWCRILGCNGFLPCAVGETELGLDNDFYGFVWSVEGFPRRLGKERELAIDF